MTEVEKVILKDRRLFQSDGINRIMRHSSFKMFPRAFANPYKIISDLDLMVPAYAYGLF